MTYKINTLEKTYLIFVKKFLCLIKIYFLFYSDFGFIIAVGHGNNNNDVFSKMKKTKTNAIYFWVGG